MDTVNQIPKVLFVAHQFPPRGGPGVHRSLNLCKHLFKFGIDPVVLTITETSIAKAGYTMDPSLLHQVSDRTKIFRTPGYEPVKFTKTLMNLKVFRFFWFIFYPLFWESSAFWPFLTYRKAKAIIQSESIKIVYTSSGPFSSLLLGRMIKKRLGLKWVADLRDPFTDAYAWNFPSKLHWKIARYFEKKILEIPDVLIVNTDAVKRLYEERGIRKNKKTIVINNGI